MSQKKFVMDGGKLKKMPGWFSWRHPTRVAHDEAREEYIASHATARARVARRQARSAA